ncbi:MAG: porin family protein [Maribacter sp.]
MHKIFITKKKAAIATSLLMFICFLNSLGVHSQSTRFGIKAGLNYSSIVGDLTNGIKFRFSGHAGVFLEVEFSDKFSFQPELLYSSQGFQFSTDLLSIQNQGGTADQNDFRTNVQFNYLTVPVLGKFALNDHLDVEFGPQFGFLLNQVTKIKNLDQRDDTLSDDRTSTSGDFQLDYGVAAGVGIRVNEHFSVSPRFYIGLRNRLNGAIGNRQNYNVALQLSANYSFL